MKQFEYYKKSANTKSQIQEKKCVFLRDALRLPIIHRLYFYEVKEA